MTNFCSGDETLTRGVADETAVRINSGYRGSMSP